MDMITNHREQPTPRKIQTLSGEKDNVPQLHKTKTERQVAENTTGTRLPHESGMASIRVGEHHSELSGGTERTVGSLWAEMGMFPGWGLCFITLPSPPVPHSLKAIDLQRHSLKHSLGAHAGHCSPHSLVQS